MAQRIQFIYLTQSEYDGLSQKNAERLYFTSDTHRIYKGSDLYATTTFDTLSASTATFGNLVVTGDVTMSLSEVTFGSINASDIQVNGSSVALEGHGHSTADISGLDALLSEYASASHSHVIADVQGLSDVLSGITSSTIYKDSATFDQVTADVGNFRLVSVSGSANFQVNNVSANAVAVNGTPVSLEGHTHTMSQITGLESYVQEFAAYESRIAALESLVSGLEQALHSINSGA